MNFIEKEGKELTAVLKELAKELNVSEEELLYKTDSKKGGLFKAATVVVKATSIANVSEHIKEYLQSILKEMGLNVTFETKIRENQITIKMYSDKNNILIGKNGQTLAALQTLVRQAVYSKIDTYPNVVLDVENYKDKQKMHLERLAKNTAREVAQTGLEVRLDNMNSFERRIVHSILSENSKVTTESAGEEPNRYVVIKPKKD